MKYILTSLTLLLAMAGCASSPPSQNAVRSTGSSYGEFPSDYKSIVLDYLKKNPPKDEIENSSISFINTPDRYIHRSYSAGGDLYGYRVCVQGTTSSVTKKSNQLHFFLINDGQVVKHSSKTGLATYFDRECSIGPQPGVAPQAASPAPENRSAEIPRSTSSTQAPQQLKYIVCAAGDSEMLLTVDESNNRLQQEVEGELVGTFAIEKISETSIVATHGQDRIFLSRVSGSLIYRKGDQKITGSCDSSSTVKY